ncbi:hypothetical protein EGW08_004147, partial [Elysia chlorotica]
RPSVVVVVVVVEAARVGRAGACAKQALVNLRHRLVVVIGRQVDSGRGVLVAVRQQPIRGHVVVRVGLSGRDRRLESLGKSGEVKLVGVTLSVNLGRGRVLRDSCSYLGHDVLVVVVAQRAAQLVVVHVGLGLALPPAARHLVRVDQLELAVRALPGDARAVTGVREQLQEELPQLDLPR